MIVFQQDRRPRRIPAPRQRLRPARRTPGSLNIFREVLRHAWVVFWFTGTSLIPMSETPGRSRHVRTKSVDSGTVVVQVPIEQKTHFLPIALYGAFRDAAQLRDFGEREAAEILQIDQLGERGFVLRELIQRRGQL